MENGKRFGAKVVSAVMAQLADRRMTAMTPEERSDVARTAARSRWDGMSEEDRKAEGARLAEARAAARRKKGKKGSK